MMWASRRSGFALIAALWLVVALTAIALHVAIRSRAAALSAANIAEGLRAQAAASSGLEHARARLQRRLTESTAASAGDAWRDLSRVVQDTIDLSEGVHYAVELRDPSSRLHLNRASEEELRRFFGAFRIDAGEADRIAQATADWRDSDDFRRARGAEREEYLEDGSISLPANAPFSDIAQLQHVRGVTEEIMRLVEPHLTLSGSGQVNLNSAPREVLLSLPGMGEEAVRLLERRGGQPIRSLNEVVDRLSPGARIPLQEAMPALQRRVDFETREVEAVAIGWLDGSPVRVRAHGLFARGDHHVFFVQRSVQ
ncbi:MAG: hypothetical protein WEE89_07635 [Gemmatimonadota bacterium]